MRVQSGAHMTNSESCGKAFFERAVISSEPKALPTCATGQSLAFTRHLKDDVSATGQRCTCRDLVVSFTLIDRLVTVGDALTTFRTDPPHPRLSDHVRRDRADPMDGVS